MSKLIYITNTRMPSEKANAYQSIQMCNSFAKIYDEIEMWLPKLRNTEEMKKYENNVYEFYGVDKSFKIIKFFTIDSTILEKISPFIWANTKSFIFALNILRELKNEKNSIVFTRDWWVLKILLLGKKIGIINNKIFYEAHKFSNHLVNNLKQADGLIVINNYLKELYKKEGIRNILVAHDGVSIVEYENISDYKYQKKDNYKLVYTGNLFKWKGVYTLVDSLKYINKNVELIIVGGSEKVFYEFQKYCIDSGFENIKLVGYIPKRDTINYVEQADILFLPNSSKDKMSFYTSPIKLFEYMASKRPIIASNLPSICEILEDKKNAILCEPDNPQDLADKIEWVLNNDCSYMVNQAYQDVQKYTWDNRAENIKNFMENCNG